MDFYERTAQCIIYIHTSTDIHIENENIVECIVPSSKTIKSQNSERKKKNHQLEIWEKMKKEKIKEKYEKKKKKIT